MNNTNNNLPDRELPQNFNYLGGVFSIWLEGGTIFGEFLGQRLVADSAGRFAPTSSEFYTKVGVDQKENANLAKDRDAMLNYCTSDFVQMFWTDYKKYVSRLEIKRNEKINSKTVYI